MVGCFSMLKRKSTGSASTSASNAVGGEKGSSQTYNSPRCDCDPMAGMTPEAIAAAMQASHSALPAYSSSPYSSSSSDDNHLSVIASYIESISAQLREVSSEMHDNPEIAWKEVKTAKLLSDFMEKQSGWKVKRGVYGTKTGWEASWTSPAGKNGKVIGFNSEMDALPGIGHACGHNLIAIAGIASALATAHTMATYQVPGKVILLGTPAEEADGGKIVMIKNGGYKEMDVCLMTHPTPYGGLVPMLAVSECIVEYWGKNAHAAGAPWEGVNALDAAVLGYNNVSALRQQIPPQARIHGIIQGSEQWVCNIIPAYSRLQFGVRHPKQSEVEKLKVKVEHCFKAAAEATGCKVKIEWMMEYLDMVDNQVLGAEYKRYMESEQKVPVPLGNDAFGSTDFGNVCYELPALHPLYAIPTKAGNHTPEFAAAAATVESHVETLKVAKGLAATAYRVATDDAFAKEVRKSWEQEYKKSGQ